MKNLLITGLLIAVLGMTFGDVMPVSAEELTAPATDLSSSEVDGLIFMREEEKLAHDVYVTLYAQWRLSIFQNIADSEATHTEAIKVLLDRYGIADPAAGKGVGEFTNSDLKTLYDQLVAQGSTSLEDALKVGIQIEELDIQDLQTRLALTSSADIQLVYNNLLRGSENHLLAFSRTLERQAGGTYLTQSPNGSPSILPVSPTGQRNGFRGGR